MLEILPIKTRVLIPPKDNIFDLFGIKQFMPKDGDILCIATKCLSIHQGRCVKIGSIDKRDLIAKEADRSFEESALLTIKDDIIIAFSGIDESNGNGYYILWPKDSHELLKQIHSFVCKKFSITRLGIVSVDSRCEPMRRGTVGIAHEIFGFKPLRDCRGCPDIFGRPMELTFVNIADCLASAACYAMGECDETQPFVIIRGADAEFGCQFSAKDMKISPDEDIFAPLLSHR